MIVLYHQEDARRMGVRAKAGRAAAGGILAAALIACVALCCQVRTGNAQTLYRWVVALFTLAGWGAILLTRFLIRPCQAEYQHMTSILSGEAEILEGKLTVAPESFQVPRSIRVRKAHLTSGEESCTLNVDDRLAAQLPPDGTHVRLQAVRRYITAVEVCHEDD